MVLIVKSACSAVSSPLGFPFTRHSGRTAFQAIMQKCRFGSAIFSAAHSRKCVDSVPLSDNPGSRAGLRTRLRQFVAPIFYLSQNPVSLVGVALATSLFFTMVVFYIATSVGVA